MCRIAVQILNKESLEIGTGGLNMELSKSLPLLEFFRATNQGVKKKAGVALNCIAMTKPQGKQIIGSMI